MDAGSSALVILVGIPLFCVLLQYYGLPLVDRLSVFLWRSLRPRIQVARQKRKDAYHEMVRGFVNDPWGIRATMRLIADWFLILATLLCIVLAALCLVLETSYRIMAMLSDSAVYATAARLSLVLYGVLLWSAISCMRKVHTARKAMEEADKQKEQKAPLDYPIRDETRGP
jgi:cell division protein FtsL